MARRLEAEKPYTPLDNHLLSSVLTPSQEPESEPAETRPKANSTTEVRCVSRRTIGVRDKNEPDDSQGGRTTLLPRAPVRGIVTEGSVSAERMNATLRLKVSSRDKREFEAFTARLAAALDTTLKPSNLLRTMLSVLQHAERELAEAARRQGPLKRPPNDDVCSYAEFESKLVRLIDSAIRQSIPVNSGRIDS